MSPLFILAIGATVNAIAVTVTRLLFPGWEVTTAGVMCFLIGAAYERAFTRPRLASLTAALNTSERRP